MPGGYWHNGLKDESYECVDREGGRGHKAPQERRTWRRKLERAGAENSRGQDGNKVIRTGEQKSPDAQIS